MSASTLIATVMKNNVEEVRVSLTSFNGFDLIDIRTYQRLLNTGGESVPTKRGVCISRDRLPDLIAALHAAEEASR